MRLNQLPFSNHFSPTSSPRRLFDLLMKYDEDVARELPLIGGNLHKYVTAYYDFRVRLSKLEEDLFISVEQIFSICLPPAWRIHLRYVLLRFAGAPQEQIINGRNLLNYGITWDAAERVFTELLKDPKLTSVIAELLELYKTWPKTLHQLLEISSQA